MNVKELLIRLLVHHSYRQLATISNCSNSKDIFLNDLFKSTIRSIRPFSFLILGQLTVSLVHAVEIPHRQQLP